MSSTSRVLPLLLCVLSPALGAAELPPRALSQLGDYHFYHGPTIECAVLSPDGSRVASVARYPAYYTQVGEEERQKYDSSIFVWDAATGERIRELRAPRGPVSHLAFSADGKFLAAACGEDRTRHAVAVFEVDSGKLLRYFGTFKSINQLQFTPDRKQLRVSEWGGPASAWDPVTGKQLRLWKPPVPVDAKKGASAVRSFLSPDGKVIIWDMESPTKEGGGSREVPQLRAHDAETGDLLYQISSDLFRLSLPFSADGKRFAGLGGRLQVWETATGKELISLAVERLHLFALAPDGRHAAVYEEGSRVRLWDLDAGKVVRDIYPGPVALRADGLRLPQVFSADGKTLLLTTATTLRLFDTTTGKERHSLGHRSPVTPRFAADGRTLFTGCGETRRSWDVAGKQPALLSERRRTPREWEARAVSADGRYLLEWDWRRYRTSVSETATGRVVSVLENNGLYPDPGAALFSPDTSLILLYASADKKPLKGGRYAVYWLCDVKTGKVLWEFQPARSQRDPVFSPDGRLIAWSLLNGDVTLRETATGKVRRDLHSTLPLPEGKGEPECLPVLFSHDSTHLMTTGYLWDSDVRRAFGYHYTIMPIRVFHLASGKEIRRFPANPTKATSGVPLACAAWSPDGRLLAVAEKDSGVVRLLEIASGKVRAEFAGHRHQVHALAYAPDGKSLASGGEDNVVFLWDVVGCRTGTAVKEPGAAELASWWSDLSAEDAKRAGDAIAALAAVPTRSVPYLQSQLRAAEAVDEKRLGSLIADLDAAVFAKREAAVRQLLAHGEQAVPRLRRTLQDRPPLEVSRRVEVLLDRIEHGPLSQKALGLLRAVETLEQLGTLAARQLLRTLGRGAPDARLTREANAALERLEPRGPLP